MRNNQTRNRPSHNQDSAAPRQQPLICTSAGPIHPVHGQPMLLATKAIPRNEVTFSPFSRAFSIVLRNLPPYNRFWYFVFSFSSKRAWQSGSKHYQRWYEGRFRQTMVDSWYCLDRIVSEEISQVARRLEVGNHKQRRTILKWALLSTGYFVHFLTLCL